MARTGSFVRVLLVGWVRAQGRPILDQFPPNRPTRAQVRRIRRGMLGALVLAWATHLMTTQWAGGASASASLQAAEEQTTLVLHLRASAEAHGAEITLGDVAFLEWKGSPIAGLGELPIAGVAQVPEPVGAEQVVGIEQIVAALEAAGVDVAQVQVHGPVRCRVSFQAGTETAPAVSTDEAALLQWAGMSPAPKSSAEPRPPEPGPPAAQSPQRPLEGSQAGSPDRPAPARGPAAEAHRAPAPADGPATRPRHASDNRPSPSRAGQPEFIGTAGTVGEVLRRDLATRLNLGPESIHLRFAGEDIPLAQGGGISPADVRALSAGDLGDVAWTVKVEGREIPIMAHASATVIRAVAVQAVAAGQIVRAGDVIGRQARIERIADRGISPGQAAGQQASRQLEAGQVLREEDLTPRLLVQAGQLITVQEMRHGTQVRGLAKALDDGWHGQVVRAQREGSEEVVQVLVTAPQAGRIVDSPGEGASASGGGDAIPGK